MKKTLVKRCQKPMIGQQKEQSMTVVGREMFSKKLPKRDIPMISVAGTKLIK